jgi:NADH dehydrogenase
MATIGRTHAVAHSGGMSFTGVVAYLMWAFIHVLYLIGWGNRFGTLYSWGRSLWFTKNRAHRIITLDQAIDEIGNQGSAVAGKIKSGNGAQAPSTTTS